MYLDFPGITRLAASGLASRLIRQIHRYANANCALILSSHTGVYVWNDSILLVAHFCDHREKKTVLREQCDFKVAIGKRIRRANYPYAIIVQGKAFPLPDGGVAKSAKFKPQIVVLKSSSWAMANCFHIESKLGGKKALWYLDSRITQGVKLKNKERRYSLRLLPSKKKRYVQ